MRECNAIRFRRNSLSSFAVVRSPRGGSAIIRCTAGAATLTRDAAADGLAASIRPAPRTRGTSPTRPARRSAGTVSVGVVGFGFAAGFGSSTTIAERPMAVIFLAAICLIAVSICCLARSTVILALFAGSFAVVRDVARFAELRFADFFAVIPLLTRRRPLRRIFAFAIAVLIRWPQVVSGPCLNSSNAVRKRARKPGGAPGRIDVACEQPSVGLEQRPPDHDATHGRQSVANENHPK